jgi:hypothetical protein
MGTSAGDRSGPVGAESSTRAAELGARSVQRSGPLPGLAARVPDLANRLRHATHLTNSRSGPGTRSALDAFSGH